MKELLTEWRKFLNEDRYRSYYTRAHWVQELAHPDTTIDTLMDAVYSLAFLMAEFLYPDDPEELEELGSGESFVRDYMSKMLEYTRVWFKNHEVQEEDEDKAKALKTFVDWLDRNVDEMIKISDSGDYENAMDSKAHKILRHIANDETGNMLVALAPQLDKF